MNDEHDDEPYVLSGSGMPQSGRGWIVLCLIVVIGLLLAALGVIRV